MVPHFDGVNGVWQPMALNVALRLTETTEWPIVGWTRSIFYVDAVAPTYEYWLALGTVDGIGWSFQTDGDLQWQRDGSDILAMYLLQAPADDVVAHMSARFHINA